MYMVINTTIEKSYMKGLMLKCALYALNMVSFGNLLIVI